MNNTSNVVIRVIGILTNDIMAYGSICVRITILRCRLRCFSCRQISITILLLLCCSITACSVLLCGVRAWPIICCLSVIGSMLILGSSLVFRVVVLSRNAIRRWVSTWSLMSTVCIVGWRWLIWILVVASSCVRANSSLLI